MSHPIWVRGLKRFGHIKQRRLQLSHPIWVRGLKPSCNAYHYGCLCRTLYGCVD